MDKNSKTPPMGEYLNPKYEQSNFDSGMAYYGQPFQNPMYSESIGMGSQSFKPMPAMDDYPFDQTQGCKIEMFFLHPEDYMVVWTNSTMVYGIQNKDTGYTVFDISPIEPALDGYLSYFIVKIRFSIDNEEVKEMTTSGNLGDPKTRIGHNILQFEIHNVKLIMSFSYLGYNEVNQAFSLQNLGFTLYMKKQKVKRPPTNKALSMKVGTYDKFLLTNSPNRQEYPQYGGPSDQKSTFAINKNLKISSKSYCPPGKISSSSSIASYKSMPAKMIDKQDREKLYAKEKERILKMDTNELAEFITDSSGNYIIQEAIRLGNPEERIHLLDKIESKIVDLSCDKKGTHPIQTMVVQCKTDEEMNRLMKILNAERQLNLSSSGHGTFIMQKVLDHFPEDTLTPIFNVGRDNFLDMSTNKNGLPIIKKALAKFKTYRHSFVEIIEENTTSLAQHPFGNYAVQVAVDNWDQSDGVNIISTVLDNLQQLSMQKFSSNVVEKGIDKSSQDTVSLFLGVINNKEFMKMAVRNMYTFFVVERAIMASNDEEVKLDIAEKIRSGVISNRSDKSLNRKWTKLYENIVDGKLPTEQVKVYDCE